MLVFGAMLQHLLLQHSQLGRVGSGPRVEKDPFFGNMLFVFFLVACVHICVQISALGKAGGGYQVYITALCSIVLYLESSPQVFC